MIADNRQIGSSRRVYVFASHPASGFSMQRYSEILLKAYESSSIDTSVLRPSNRLSRHIRSAAVKKFATYLESLILFPALFLTVPRNASIHIADHSDAMWVIFLALLRRTDVRVTCHDLIAVKAALGEIPEHRTRWSGRLYQKFVLQGLRRAKMVFCVSDATRSDVARLVPGSCTKILYNPIDPALRRVSLRRQDSEPYLLVVSTTGWRKRRARAVEVWRALQSNSDRKLRLVIVGPKLTPSESQLDPLNEIRQVSGLSDAEMADLYAGATALLQQSLYEGYGWPIVEANLHGTPAVCSDLPVFREIGPGNIFLPENLDDLDWTSLGRNLDAWPSTGVFESSLRRFEWEIFVSKLSASVVGQAQ